MTTAEWLIQMTKALAKAQGKTKADKLTKRLSGSTLDAYLRPAEGTKA